MKEYTELELNDMVKILPREIYYVSVSEHFTQIKKLTFSRVAPEFYGVGRLSFNILEGYTDAKDKTIRLSPINLKNDIYFSFDEAIDKLREKLEKTLKYNKDCTATNNILRDEINKRFGQALYTYHFNKEK